MPQSEMKTCSVSNSDAKWGTECLDTKFAVYNVHKECNKWSVGFSKRVLFIVFILFFIEDFWFTVIVVIFNLLFHYFWFSLQLYAHVQGRQTDAALGNDSFSWMGIECRTIVYSLKTTLFFYIPSMYIHLNLIYFIVV